MYCRTATLVTISSNGQHQTRNIYSRIYVYVRCECVAYCENFYLVNVFYKGNDVCLFRPSKLHDIVAYDAFILLLKRVSMVLFDRRIRLWVKRKVYKTVVRPAMLYGAQTWVVMKAQERKLDVAEMRMLRLMRGATKLDRIGNEEIS